MKLILNAIAIGRLALGVALDLIRPCRPEYRLPTR